MTGGVARAAIASGSAPKRNASAAVPSGAAEAPMITTSARLGLAEDGVADVGRLAQEAVGVAARVLLEERGEGVLGLGPDACS